MLSYNSGTPALSCALQDIHKVCAQLGNNDNLNVLRSLNLV